MTLKAQTVLKRIFAILIAFPIAAVLVALAVANRHPVQLVLDPFRPDSPAIALVLPFYAYLFGALALGILAGGVAVWRSQSHWRHTARSKSQEARRWQSEADRLTRERDAEAAANSRPLIASTR